MKKELSESDKKILRNATKRFWKPAKAKHTFKGIPLYLPPELRK